jgi:hypothetical protein
MSSHTFQLSNRSRRLLWRNQHKEYQESIAVDTKPAHSAPSPGPSSKWMRLWDPVASLPLELALMCLQEALPLGKDYPAALIELTSVSSKWQEFLFSVSHFWTKIHVRYSSHDLMAIIGIFLHLSANAPLDLVVWNILGSEWEDAKLLLLPHAHRIHSLALGDDPPIYYDSPYTGAAYISLASDIFNSLDRLPGLVDLDFGRTLHIDPSQLKILDMPSEIRVFNSIEVSLHNIKDPNHSLFILGGREGPRCSLDLPGGLVFLPDSPSGKQVVYSRGFYSYPDCTILSLNTVISFMIDTLSLLDAPDTTPRLSSSLSYIVFVDTSFNACHLCSMRRGSLLRVVGCVRSHFGLHPFRCPGCRTCNSRKGCVPHAFQVVASHC